MRVATPCSVFLLSHAMHKRAQHLRTAATRPLPSVDTSASAGCHCPTDSPQDAGHDLICVCHFAGVSGVRLIAVRLSSSTLPAVCGISEPHEHFSLSIR